VPRRPLHGVFIASDAIAEGAITRKQLRLLGYRRLVQGVYADPGIALDHRLRCTGVALLLPRGTAIGGHSAAAWYGAPFAGVNDPVTVLRPAGVRWAGPRGVRVHQTVLAPGDVTTVDDVPISSPLQTAWDVAALEPLGTGVAALDAMVRTGCVSMNALAARLEGSAGDWGITKVRRAFELVDPRAESSPESKVRVALVLAGLAPVPQFRVLHRGEFVARVDFAWPEAKLVVEYEGAHHFSAERIIEDDQRYAALIAAGWRIIRLYAPDLRNLDDVVRRIREALT
jgi:very-short-patch-repair endonuclease